MFTELNMLTKQNLIQSLYCEHRYIVRNLKFIKMICVQEKFGAIKDQPDSHICFRIKHVYQTDHILLLPQTTLNQGQLRLRKKYRRRNHPCH